MAHPHHEAWRQVRGLVADGVSFCTTGGGSARGGLTTARHLNTQLHPDRKNKKGRHDYGRDPGAYLK